jgi:hypothetical protein
MLTDKSRTKDRVGRAPTNAQQHRRLPKNPNPHNVALHEEILCPKSALGNIPYNPAPALTAESIETTTSATKWKEEWKQLSKSDGKAIDKAFVAEQKSIISDPTLSAPQRRKVGTMRIKSQRKWRKLYRRLRTVISPKCNRCNSNHNENTVHMLRDCPMTKPFLKDLRSSIDQFISHHSGNKLGWTSLWKPLDKQLVAGSMPLADQRTYWLLMGLAPAGMATVGKALAQGTEDISRYITRAVRECRLNIVAQKTKADNIRYLKARTAFEASLQAAGAVGAGDSDDPEPASQPPAH